MNYPIVFKLNMEKILIPRVVVVSHDYCTVLYPGVDKVKVKVNIGRRLGEATPSASIAKRKRRQDKASPRAGDAKVGRRQGKMSRKQGNHSVAPRYPWVGKTMDGVTPWEGLKPR